MSEYMWGAFVVIAIIAFSAAGAATIIKYMDGFKECTTNSGCAQDNYCGADFSCHSHPVITRTVVNNDYTTPAALLGLSVVIGVMIVRRKREEPHVRY